MACVHFCKYEEYIHWFLKLFHNLAVFRSFHNFKSNFKNDFYFKLSKIDFCIYRKFKKKWQCNYFTQLWNYFKNKIRILIFEVNFKRQSKLNLFIYQLNFYLFDLLKFVHFIVLKVILKRISTLELVKIDFGIYRKFQKK